VPVERPLQPLLTHTGHPSKWRVVSVTAATVVCGSVPSCSTTKLSYYATAAASTISFNDRRCTFPVGPFGKSGRKTNLSGTL
jgi:hypothetical protein